jgi:hypothetical protein
MHTVPLHLKTIQKTIQPPLWRVITAALCCVGLWSCATTVTPPSRQSQEVSVAAVRQAEQAGIKRQQLEVEIRRFADRYGTVMSLEADRIMDRAGTPELRWFATGIKLSIREAVLDIAVGPNAVENLLDMLVLTTLQRQDLETHWVPKFLGPKLGQGLLNAARQHEEEIWDIAQNVLNAKQQTELRELIQEWREAHPNQHYTYGVRFAGFSGQRAQDLGQVRQTGGLLGEVAQARETVDEVRQFSERLLYYLQRAPSLTRLEAEFGMRGLFKSQEFRQLLDNAERVTRSTEAYADLARNFPAEREAALTQLIALEREALKDLLKSDELRGTVGQLSDEGDQIVNTAFIRGSLLVLLWVFGYVVAKLAHDYISGRRSKK